ncbi:MAG: DUF6268 family outer membrane beta-barrel protein [Candidatus Omnitrophica bacterium]|nr:DUF6268 family outer membrane beta-barrel protein [Candidatus Omnitrophota bacterium]
MMIRLILAIIFLLSFHPALRAETTVAAEAASVAETQPVSEGAEEGIEYRQKLGKVITMEDEENKVGFEADSYARYMPTRSLVSQPGKISVTKAASEFSYAFKAFGELPVEFAIGGENVDINTNDAVPVSLPSHLTELTFGAEATLPAFGLEKTYIRLGITPAFYSSNWNFKANSFNFGSHALVIYQATDKLTLVAGVSVSPGFEDPITPFGGLIYKPNDKLTFDLVPTRPAITYQINDRIAVFGEAGFEGSEFKVSKDGYTGAALSYNEVHFGGGIKFSVNKYIDTYLSCGRMINHYFKYRDSLGKVDMKDNTYSEFRVEVKI